MRDPSLSPFLERPSKVDIAQASSRERVARLEYEVASLKTEKRLMKQAQDAAVAKYERLLLLKNDELSQLQTNFDYLYSSRKELEAQLTEAKGTATKSTEGLNKELSQLRADQRKNKSRLLQIEKLYQKTSEQCEHLRLDLNCELTSNDQYRQRVESLHKELEAQTAINSDLLKQLLLASNVRTGAGRELEAMNMRCASLQKTNNELQCRLDVYLQQKTGNELLKHKNASLMSQIQALEGYKEKCARVEQMYSELQVKFDEYFTAISDSLDVPEGTEKVAAVKDFVLSFRSLQNKHLVTFDKLNAAETRVEHLETLLAESQQLCQMYMDQMQTLKAQEAERDAKLASLSNSAVLNQKEIEFLRQSLKDWDRINSERKASSGKVEPSAETKSNGDLYLANLEKLVDDYKQEIENLRKHIAATGLQQSDAPTKRPRLIDDEGLRAKTITALRNENIELMTQIKSLKDEVNLLRKNVNNSTNKGAILELRKNPFNDDQLVKQETLEALRTENRDLIAKYIENQQVEVVPRTVYARQEHDKEVQQDKIDTLVKKISRLQTVYAERSKDIMALVSRYFGYSIEFVPNPINPNDFCSKIKLISRYLRNSDLKKEPPYLILDVQKRSMKAHGDYEFKKMCEELVEQWVQEKYQIPCFLSALNLQIYAQTTANGH